MKRCVRVHRERGRFLPSPPVGEGRGGECGRPSSRSGHPLGSSFMVRPPAGPTRGRRGSSGRRGGSRRPRPRSRSPSRGRPPRSGGRRRPRGGCGAGGLPGSGRSAGGGRSAPAGRARGHRRGGGPSGRPGRWPRRGPRGRSPGPNRAGAGSGTAFPRGAPGSATGVAGRSRSRCVSAEGAWNVRMKKARNWNAMSSIGVTGNWTPSGSSGRRERLAVCAQGSRSSLAAPQDDQAEMGKAPLLCRGQVRRTAPYEACLSARRMTTVDSSSTGPPSVSCPSRRCLACSAHHAWAAFPSRASPFASSRPRRRAPPSSGRAPGRPPAARRA